MASYTPPTPISPWPQFNSLQFIVANQSVSRNYVDSTFLKLSGGTMLGAINSLDINMQGNLSLQNTSKILSIANTTSSISNITGALQIQGGAFIGGDNYFTGNTNYAGISSRITMSGLNSGIDLSGTNSTLILSNTANSTSSITGAIQSAGGIYSGGNNVFNGNTTYIGANSTILFSGNSTLINMTGSASRIEISGANSDIYLSGNNAHIDLLNTSASSNINTGCLRAGGGCYFGNDSVFNTQITIGSSVLNSTNAGYLTSIAPGTVSASKCIVVDLNKDISNFRHLGMTGTFSCSTINSSGIYTNSNTTNATTYTTGSITTLGGVSLGKDLYVQGIIQTNNSINMYGSIQGCTFLVCTSYITASGYISTTSTTDSTSISTGALLSSGGLGITKNAYIGGKLYCVDTNVSTTGSSNSVQFSGGLYMAKAILNNSYYNCNTINSSATSHATSIQAICLNDHAVYFRGQNSSDTNHGLMYSKNASWNSGNGFASANIDGPVLYGYGGVLIGNLNSSGTQTETARFVGNKCTIKETLQVGSSSSAQLFIGTTGMVNPQGPVNINGLGGHVKMSYNNATGTETVYTSVGCGSTGFQTLACVNGAQSWSYYFDSLGKFSTGNSLPRFDVDFGSSLNNFKVCLYNASNLVPTYGFGVNDSATMYHSAGSNGHRFYINTTGGVNSPTTVGTKYMELTSSALTLPSGYVDITKDTYGYSQSSGSGVILKTYVSGNTDAAIGTFSNHPFFLYTNNAPRVYITTGGLVGIGTTSPACNLHVVGTTAQSNPFTFGFLNNGGAGSSTGFTNRQFSIRSSGGILTDAGEIDTFSDIRMKYDINNLSSELCNKFIDKIQPISFKYNNRENDRLHYGFNAQELMSYGFTSLVGGSYDENDLLEESIVECEDGNTIKLEKNTRLVVSMLDMIPILMNVIKEQKKELTDLKTTVNNLVSVLTPGALRKFTVLVNSIE